MIMGSYTYLRSRSDGYRWSVVLSCVERELFLRLLAGQPDDAKSPSPIQEVPLVQVRHGSVNTVGPPVRVREVEAWLKGQQPLDALLRIDIAATPPRAFGRPPLVDAGKQMSSQPVTVV